MLKEKDIEIEGYKFVISKFPAKQGFYIVARMPSDPMAAILDFERYKEVTDEVFSFAGIRGADGRVLYFTTDALFNNHVDNWEIAGLLLSEIMNYNTGFLKIGA